MQEFDTYKCIERYAKYPHDPQAVLGFRALEHKTLSHVFWHALQSGSINAIDANSKLFLGAQYQGEPAKKEDTSFTTDSFMSMKREDQLNLFSALCNSVGVSIDPKTLMNKT